MMHARFYRPGLHPTVLMVALLAFVRPSPGAVRFDVVGSPTEVINTGRSEVLGSVNLFVRGSGNVTGTATGGAVQINFAFTNPALEIDNTQGSGIRIFTSPRLEPAAPTIVSIGNQEIGGRCVGFLTLRLGPGATPAEGDFIRIEGIRGRIDHTEAISPGTDLFVSLQSANDPTATSFFPDRVRVATSFNGLELGIVELGASLQIVISEGFARAFVDMDAGDDGTPANDRTDTGSNPQGAPANSTQFLIRLGGIPSGISDVTWPARSSQASTGASLRLLSKIFSVASATALYTFDSPNQIGSSDLHWETFAIYPGFVFSSGACNTDDLTASVTLAPVVQADAGCASLSDAVARPRFREAYALHLRRLSPSLISAGSPAFNLTVHGTGFVPSSVVRWNGSPRPTSFLSGTQLAITVEAPDLIKAGAATVTVTNPPEVGGAASNPLTFRITPPELTLFFPCLVSGAEDPANPGPAEFTGIALVNLSGRTADLKLTAFGPTGVPLAGPDITNPATLKLQDGRQVPLMAHQLFGAGLSAHVGAGWFKLEGNVPQVLGLFLTSDGALQRLDGAEASTRPSRSLVLPEIAAGGPTQIHVANPNDDPAAVTIEIVGPDGIPRAAAAERVIPPSGVLAESLDDLFPGSSPQAADYIRAQSNREVVGFEQLARNEGDVAGLNGLDAASGSRLLYSPQFVAGGGWESRVSVLNLGQRPGRVSIRLMADAGTQIGATRVVAVPAAGKIQIAAQEFLPGAEGGIVQGYLEIVSDGIPISGSVVFGSAEPGRLLTALPLVSTLAEYMIFGQVASNSTFFTGLAILNPNEYQATAVIQVFDREGRVLASKTELFPAMGRISMLLTEYFPALAGQDIPGGYMVIRAMRGMAAFALFGTRDLSVLSAIPAQ